MKLIHLPLFAVLAIPAPVVAQGLTVDDSFPADVRRDLATVATDTLACCRQLWPGKPPAGERPIVLSYRAAGPITDSTGDTKMYRIHVSVKQRYYTQFAYQLSHEFAHIMLDPRRTNGLVETLAVAFSLHALDEMSQRWKKKAPHASWSSHAPVFANYRRTVEKFHLKTFPLSVQALVERGAYADLALYLRHRRADLDAVNRDLQHLAALALLSREVRWTTLTGLARHTNPPPSKDDRFRADLPLLTSRLPGALRRIGYRREADFVSAQLSAKPAVKSGLVLQVGAGKWLYLYEARSIDATALDRLIRELKPTAVRREAGTR
jgi:hypothetical protein